MLDLGNAATPLDAVAHIIQVALTPVFLLTGLATLLNVFSTRLGRVADRVHQLSEAIDGVGAGQAQRLAVEMAHLHRRTTILDIAVILAAVGGAATCAAVLALFVGALRDATVAFLLFILFGGAVLCALGAIAAFTVEMLIASVGVRAQLAAGRRSDAPEDAPEASKPHPGNSADAPGPADPI
jgi:hypothetical protein